MTENDDSKLEARIETQVARTVRRIPPNPTLALSSPSWTQVLPRPCLIPYAHGWEVEFLGWSYSPCADIVIGAWVAWRRSGPNGLACAVRMPGNRTTVQAIEEGCYIDTTGSYTSRALMLQRDRRVLFQEIADQIEDARRALYEAIAAVKMDDEQEKGEGDEV